MAFNHSEFLVVSRAIQAGATSPSEGFIRTGVSRAYYFAFLESREQARSRGLFKPDAGKIHHSVLIRKLKGSSSSRIRALGHKLETFKTDRERADYELNSSVSLGDLAGAILLAQFFETEWSAI